MDSYSVRLTTSTGRQGIIPCARCAFFDACIFTANQPRGHCRVRPPVARMTHRQADEDGDAVWPIVSADDGCGEGLLREEAAPLPPKVQ